MSVLVVGGAGVLGKAVLKSFAPIAGSLSSSLSVDLVPSDVSAHSVVVNQADTNTKTILNTADQVSNTLKTSGLKNVETIVCAAGSWAGGGVDSAEGLEAIDSMIQANLQSAVLAAHLATKFLKPNGLVVFTGADAAMMKPTPGMMGYGLAKVATHHLATSLASSDGGLPSNSSVVTILPKVIDTPNNRKFMPESNFDEWSNPDEIANEIKQWSENKNRPPNGSFVALNTSNGKTSFDIFGHPIN